MPWWDAGSLPDRITIFKGPLTRLCDDREDLLDEIVVVDPGPDDDGHLDAILGCGGDRIRWIACTHTHPDHHPLTARLAKRTGAEVMAFDSRDGLNVDVELRDGDVIEATEFRLRAVHTPGHASNHLCYLLQEERLLFSGDHIMQGSTVVIAPPDGDMAAYLQQLVDLVAQRAALHLVPEQAARAEQQLARVHGLPDDPVGVDEGVGVLDFQGNHWAFGREAVFGQGEEVHFRRARVPRRKGRRRRRGST